MPNALHILDHADPEVPKLHISLAGLSGNYTLNETQAGYEFFVLEGAKAGNVNIIIPSSVYNGRSIVFDDISTGGFVTVQTSALGLAATLSVNINEVYSDGVDVESVAVTTTQNVIFKAHNSAPFALAASTWRKAACDTVEVDSSARYDAVNYRFQPNVAGWYSMTGNMVVLTTACSVAVAFYKNGAAVGIPFLVGNASSGTNLNDNFYLNGTTDYIEMWILATVAQNANANFSGVLIRSM